MLDPSSLIHCALPDPKDEAFHRAARSPFNTRGTRREPRLSLDSTGPLITLMGCLAGPNDIVCSGGSTWDTRSRSQIVANGYEPNPGGINCVH